MSDTLRRTGEWFMEAVPKPDEKNAQTQMGTHFEEVAEMILEIKGGDRLTQAMLTAAMVANHALAMHLKTSKAIVARIPTENRINMLDALCDQIVTGMGVGHMLRFAMVPAMYEVNRSNFSKFVDGKAIFDSNRKIAKGPEYTRPNLKDFV